MAGDANLQNYEIVNKIISSLNKSLDDIVEQDVLTILQAFPYIPASNKQANKLFGSLNNTVAEVCMNQPENATLGFLASYLGKFFEINRTRFLKNENKKNLLALLETKIKALKDNNQDILPGLLDNLVKVLYVNTQSTFLRDIVKESLIKNAKRVEFDTFKTGISAIRMSLSKEENGKKLISELED